MEDSIQFPTKQQTIRKLKDDNTFETQFGTLLHYDIIKSNDPDRIIIDQIMNEKKNELHKLSKQERRCIGCFVGSAIGDTLGNQTDQFVLDYNRNIITSFDSLNKNLRCPIALFTDDTSLALCIADSLLANQLQFNPSDIRHRFVLWWYESYNNGKSEYFKEENKDKEEYNLKELKENVRVELWDSNSFGIGITTFNSFLDFVQNPSKTRIKDTIGNQNSNGSLMRLSPIPILYHDNISAAVDLAEKQSYLTNDGLEAAETCKLLTYLIVKLINDDIEIDENNKSNNNNDIVKEKIDKALQNVMTELDLESSVKYLAQSKKEEVFYKDEYNKCIEDRDWDWRSNTFKFSITRSEQSPTGIGAYSMDSLAMALHLNYHNASYESVIFKSANLGGDSDTNTCIAGMLAGAIYGLNQSILHLHSFIYPAEQNKTALRAYKLFHKKYIN